MTEADRRKFLAVTGAGVAAGAWGLASPAHAARGLGAPQVRESVVAYVEDHESDEVRLLLGDREVVVRDRALVRSILAAAAGGQ